MRVVALSFVCLGLVVACDPDVSGRSDGGTDTDAAMNPRLDAGPDRSPAGDASADGSVGGCEPGQTELLPCGLNGRGQASRTCVGGTWSALGTCNDPDVCGDAAVETLDCGFNGRGQKTRTCESGSWLEFAACVDPDSCTDHTLDFQSCGVNGRGSETRTCEHGQWQSGQCEDDEECQDGAERVEACGEGSAANRQQHCDHGHWSAWSACTTTECSAGAREARACGINARGSDERVCEQGHWTAFAGCHDPDECLDEASEQRTCGPNLRGVQNRACRGGHWMEWNPCSDRDVCEDDTQELAPCGLNQRGQRKRFCEGGLWGEWAACVDPDDCVDGSPASRGCGLNGRGTETQRCESGHWGPFDTCAEVDVCHDGESASQACGVNGRGTLDLTCTLGHWTFPTVCIDPDQCRDGDRSESACGINQAGTAVGTCREGKFGYAECVEQHECWYGTTETRHCGFNGRGTERRDCGSGSWLPWSGCSDPDACENGSTRTTDCGSQRRGSATDTCAGGQWQPGECSSCQDHDGDGHGIDCNAGLDCDETDERIYVGARELDRNGRDDDCDPSTGNEFIYQSGSALGGVTKALTIDDGRIYAGVGRELHVFDARDPSVLLARVPLRATVLDVAVRQGVAYVAIETTYFERAGLAVVDLRDVARPSLPRYLPHEVSALSVDGDRLYTLYQGRHNTWYVNYLSAWDLVDPARPQQLPQSADAWADESRARLVAAQGKVLVLANEFIQFFDGLTLARGATIYPPSITPDSRAKFADLTVDDQMLYATSSAGLLRYDLSEQLPAPTWLTRAYSYGLPDLQARLVRHGQRLYEVVYEGLREVPLGLSADAYPISPRVIPSPVALVELATGGELYAATDGGIKRVEPESALPFVSVRAAVHPSSLFRTMGQRAVVASTERLSSVDVRDPLNLRVEWVEPIKSRPWAMTAESTRVAVVGQRPGADYAMEQWLSILDLQPTRQLNEVRLPSECGFTYDVALVQHYSPATESVGPAAAVACGNKIVWVDLRPASFGQTSSSDVATKRLFARGTNLYIHDGGWTRSTVMVTSPALRSESFSYVTSFGGEAGDLLFDEDRVYALSGNSLTVLSARDADSWEFVKRVQIGEYGRMQKVGNRIYASNQYSFTWVDVTAPLDPVALPGMAYYPAKLGTIAGSYMFRGDESVGFGVDRLFGSW